MDSNSDDVVKQNLSSSSILQVLSSLKPEVQFFEHGNFVGEQILDSLDLIRLVGLLEETFAVSIEGSEMLPQNFHSVASIEALVRRNRKQSDPDD